MHVQRKAQLHLLLLIIASSSSSSSFFFFFFFSCGFFLWGTELVALKELSSNRRRDLQTFTDRVRSEEQTAAVDVAAHALVASALRETAQESHEHFGALGGARQRRGRRCGAGRLAVGAGPGHDWDDQWILSNVERYVRMFFGVGGPAVMLRGPAGENGLVAWRWRCRLSWRPSYRFSARRETSAGSDITSEESGRITSNRRPRLAITFTTSIGTT